MTRISLALAAAVSGVALATGTPAAALGGGTANGGTTDGVSVSAAAFNLSGSCRARRGNYGNLKAYYYTRGRYDIFNRMNWNLAGPGLRNKNNVTLRLREHLNLRPDRTLWRWQSRDNVRRGTGGVSLNEAVPRRAKVHADFTFVFDRSGSDPRCHGRTNSA
ncbi:hypothetical protein [Spongiactinospora sp. 9N601]|uniref:hypothetical protein n=1 Tax=Spongiactinospora sp. 9N601 TaxID=3375149 RepID=UPI0037C8987F